MSVSANHILTVRDIMSVDVVKVTPDTPLMEARKLFEKYRIRHAPVVLNDRLLGIISLTDVMRLSFGDTYGTDEEDVDKAMADLLQVAQIMNYRPVTVHPDDTVKAVAELLSKAEFHALPVVEDNNLVGIITTTDILKALLKLL
jgi:CBS domain-containing protein